MQVWLTNSVFNYRYKKMDVAITSKNPTLLQGSKSIQPTTKATGQQSVIHEEAQLAIPLKDKNFDSVEVILVCKKLMDGFDHPNAQNEIGLAFLQVPTEFLSKPTDREAFDVEAYKHFRLAAKNGNKEGQNNLGFTYEKGIGVDKNIEAATKWYERAADQGLDVARANFERLTRSDLPGNVKVSGLLQKFEGKENNATKNNLGLIYGNTRRVFEGNGLEKNTLTTIASPQIGHI